MYNSKRLKRRDFIKKASHAAGARDGVMAVLIGIGARRSIENGPK